MRKIIRDESKIENVVKYFIETGNVYEINKYFTLIEEEFLKVFGYNNKNLTFNDIVKNINIILERMGEVSITEVANKQPNKPADTKAKKIGNLITRINENRLVIATDKTYVFVVPVLTGSKKEILIFKKGSNEGYTRAVVGDISKTLGILPAELKSVIKSTTIPTVYDELVSTYKLSPIVEDIGKARGRPTKESMLEIPITTPTTTPQRIQSPPSHAPTMTTPQPRIQSLQVVAPQPVIAGRTDEDYESISGTRLPASSYAEIDKDLSDAFNIASVNIRNPEATGAIIERGFMRITNNLFLRKF
jgi:hypothetical protein